MDVDGVVVDGGGTGVVVMWRMSEARGRNICIRRVMVRQLVYRVHEGR